MNIIYRVKALKDEAIRNIKEAIEGYVAALAADDLPVPEEHLKPWLLRYEPLAADFRPAVCKGTDEGRFCKNSATLKLFRKSAGSSLRF